MSYDNGKVPWTRNPDLERPEAKIAAAQQAQQPPALVPYREPTVGEIFEREINGLVRQATVLKARLAAMPADYRSMTPAQLAFFGLSINRNTWDEKVLGAVGCGQSAG